MVTVPTRFPFLPQAGQSNRFPTVVAVFMGRPFCNKTVPALLSPQLLGGIIDLARECKVKADVTDFRKFLKALTATTFRCRKRSER
jgi:hypothetical protein